ncbi:MAG: hypothetical protein ACR2PQ_07145 [Myxococcota bacterium]
MQRRAAPLLCLLWIAVAFAGPVAAESPAEPGAIPSGESSPTLDRLLELPSGLNYGGGEKGGMTPGEWRVRYQELRGALAYEEKVLADAQAQMDKVASTTSAWTLAAPIPGASAGNSDAPLDYQLRQQIQRHKNEIEHLERALRELDVRADLAGVPAEWRQ